MDDPNGRDKSECFATLQLNHVEESNTTNYSLFSQQILHIQISKF